MKIAYDAKRYFHNRSGLGNYSRDVVRIIQENGEEEVLLLDANSEKQELGKHGLYKYLPSFFWRSYGIWRNVKKLEANVFHGLSNELPFGKAPQGVKVVVTIHDVIFKHYPSHYKPIDRFIYDYKTRKACQNADEIIAISPQTREDLMKFYKVPEEKVKVIYQPTANKFRKDQIPEEMEKCKKKYGLPNEFFLYVSSFEERKNQSCVIEVFKELKQGYLVLAGFKGSTYEKVKSLITKYDLGDKVFLITDASSEELKSLYRLSFIFLYPSVMEGFGIPVLEALHSDKTVYCNGNENFKKMFGDACLYFDVKETDSLVKLIESGKQIQKREREEILEQFDEKKLAKEIVKTYK